MLVILWWIDYLKKIWTIEMIVVMVDMDLWVTRMIEYCQMLENKN